MSLAIRLVSSLHPFGAIADVSAQGTLLSSIPKTVWAYNLEELLSTNSADSLPSRRVTHWRHRVEQFIAGTIDGRGTLVYLRRFTSQEYETYERVGAFILHAAMPNFVSVSIRKA